MSKLSKAIHNLISKLLLYSEDDRMGKVFEGILISKGIMDLNETRILQDKLTRGSSPNACKREAILHLDEHWF